MAELPDLGVVYRYEPSPVAGSDADAESPSITMAVLHEAGQDEQSLLEAARQVAPGAALLSPRGALEVDGGGYRHLPVRTVDKPTNADDTDPHVEAIHQRSAELAAWVAQACDALGLDRAAVWLFGFGDGATAAAALAYDHPDTVAGAVVLSGCPPFRPRGGRILDLKQVFCATGRNDETVTMDDYEELVEGLVTAGADVELHWYDVGHELCEAELDDAREWLRKRLADS